MATAEIRAAFAEAAPRDGIALEPASFDWLCEQGHVGLERVAKARRDPAIVAPVIAALDVLAPSAPACAATSPCSTRRARTCSCP